MERPPLHTLLILLFCVFCALPVKAQDEEKFVAVLLRDIGHQFLTEIGDTTSRILEVTHEKNTYLLRFENDIAFTPDQLYNKVHELMRTHNAKQNFIVEVSTCDSNKIVHSFKASIDRDEEILPCKGRPLPKACYQIFFTASQPWIPYEAKVEEHEEASWTSYWIIAVVALLILLLIWRQKNGKTEEILTLGEYKFDLQRMKLLYKEEVIELSSLEADLLHLFIQHKNETLKREFILNEVWEDEGNYVGRTLDVFISKLRKKLENDESLKIISVRGVGYKFVN